MVDEQIAKAWGKLHPHEGGASEVRAWHTERHKRCRCIADFKRAQLGLKAALAAAAPVEDATP